MLVWINFDACHSQGVPEFTKRACVASMLGQRSNFVYRIVPDETRGENNEIPAHVVPDFLGMGAGARRIAARVYPGGCCLFPLACSSRSADFPLSSSARICTTLAFMSHFKSMAETFSLMRCQDS